MLEKTCLSPKLSTHLSPQVSIIIPAYNAAAYITETLDSVLAQTYQNFEVIVINDGSTDATEQVLTPYEKRFAGRLLYIKQDNQGPASARNAGLRRARGKYLSLLDSDDLWLPGYLTQMIELIEADVHTDAAFPNAIFFGDSEYDGQEFQQIYPACDEITFEKVLNHECHIFISVLCKREAVERVGGFDEHLEGMGAEDFELWLRMLRQGCRFTFTTEPLVKYRRQPDSISRNGVTLLRQINSVYEKTLRDKGITPRARKIAETKLTEVRAQLNHALFKAALMAGQYQEATAHLALANRQLNSFKLTLVQMGLRIAPGLMARLAAR